MSSSNMSVIQTENIADILNSQYVSFESGEGAPFLKVLRNGSIITLYIWARIIKIEGSFRLTVSPIDKIFRPVVTSTFTISSRDIGTWDDARYYNSSIIINNNGEIDLRGGVNISELSSMLINGLFTYITK